MIPYSIDTSLYTLVVGVKLVRTAADVMPSLNDPSIFDRNRRVGSGDRNASTGFRPRVGASVELFGQPMTLGPEHALGLLMSYVAAGLEGCLAAVAMFLGYIYFKAQPLPPMMPSSETQSSATRRVARQRQPGIWGTIMHFVGPVPEGSPVTLSLEESSSPVDNSGTALRRHSGGAGNTTSAQATQQAQAKAAAQTWTAEDEAKAKAVRAAAGRAAVARLASVGAGSGS